MTLTNETTERIKQLINSLGNLFNYRPFWDSYFTRTHDSNLFNRYHEMLTNKSFSWANILTNNLSTHFFYSIINAGNYEKLIKYYNKLLLDKNFIDQYKSIVIHIIIGYNYFHLSKYDAALTYYNIAFSQLDADHKLTGEIYHHIGDVWKAVEDFDSALLCYDHALRILNNHHVKVRYIAPIHRKISDIYRKQQNFEMANFNEEQADQLDETFRQTSELDHQKSLEKYQHQLDTQSDLSSIERADKLYSMGVRLIKIGDYSQALEKFSEAKELFETHIPFYDRFLHRFTTLFEGIAAIYFLRGEHFNALTIWKRSIDIRMSFQSN